MWLVNRSEKEINKRKLISMIDTAAVSDENLLT